MCKINKRNETIKVKVGNIEIGGNNKVIIQSMCNIKTSNFIKVSEQINYLASLGAEMMRVSCMDEADARAIKEIKKRISIPLVADIHFDPHLALLAMENGVDKIRINPGNIPLNSLKEIIKKAKEKNVAIRIGVNSGSLDKETLSHYNNQVTADGMIELLSKYVKLFEEENFDQLVLSLKASSPLLSIEAYEKASKIFKYPLHLGITEAGGKETGLIRSAAGLSPLLLQGIGNTIRISLSCDPKEEIIACKYLLNDLGLYKNVVTFISCPTCGRTEVDIFKIVNEITPFLQTISCPITVAVMGCIVNGPGEASHADIGLAGGKNKFALFKKGKLFKTCDEKDAINLLKEEILNLVEEKKNLK